MDPVEAGLNLRAELLASGVTDRELRSMRKAGVLEPLRPGAYLAAEADQPQLDPIARHRFAVLAAVPRLREGTVISHASAAVLHGLPLWEPAGRASPIERVHATRDRRTGARRSGLLDLHSAALEPDEVEAVAGVLVTSAARTVVDLARTLPMEEALVPADAALQRGLTSPEQLAEGVRRSVRRHGNAAARRVVAFADGRAESPGESRSRLALHRSGLPAPVLQQELRAPGGRSFRVDFWWRQGVVGEFDGRVKYGRLVRPGEGVGDVVYAEKLREDALRGEGLRVVRWTWADLSDFGPVAARLRRALAAG